MTNVFQTDIFGSCWFLTDPVEEQSVLDVGPMTIVEFADEPFCPEKIRGRNVGA